MPRRAFKLSRGHYYHIYNRGSGRSPIFFNSENYSYCLRLAKKYGKKYSVSIIAYCLMPNHYHFLLRQNSDILISKFIGVLFNAYVQAVNSQQGRTGSLFEGRFKCIHVDQEPYLLQLCRYIHANPVNGGLVPNPDDWPYSNYLEWLGTRQGTLVDQVFVENYFPDRTKYQEFMLEYLQGIDELPGKLDGYLLDGLA